MLIKKAEWLYLTNLKSSDYDVSGFAVDS